MQQANLLTDQNQLQCADEKIHLPGAIQPHGALIALTEDTLLIVQVSESVFTVFGIAPESLIGQPIQTLFGSDGQAQLERQLAAETILLHSRHLTIDDHAGRKKLEASIHRSDGLVLIEVEEITNLQLEQSLDFFRTCNLAIAQVLACTTQQQLLELAAELVRTLTGFDRVLVYLFDSEWSGTVLAESKRAGEKSYLGQKFPASDIPPQARELYKRNLLRLLVNVDAVPSLICPPNNPLTSAPLDLSDAILRAMSPVHIQYLKNMGVAASMSLSLISNGELRGLIACHHTTAKFVDYRVRQACDFLSRVVSLQIDAIQERQTFKDIELLKDARKELLLRISGQEDLPSAMATGGAILRVVRASGAAIILDERCFLVGKTPNERQIAQLIATLSESSLPVFVSDSVSKYFPAAKSMTATASGLLAIRLETGSSRWLLWFRPEQLEEVSWAGKHDECVEEKGASSHLSPRKSFDIWKETVTGKSEAWLSCEVQSAFEVRADVLAITLANSEKKHAAGLERQVQELNSLSQQLLLARDEAMEASKRKSEMVSLVSHDLRAPLTSIKGALSILNGGMCQIDAKGAELVAIAYTGCDYLLNLINNLLNLETIESGGITLEKSKLSLHKLVNDAFQLLRSAADLHDIKLVAEVGSLTVIADKERLLQILVNLISNAIKFSPEHSQVIVSAHSNDGAIIIKVADQGRGIPLEFKQSIFQRFKQVESADRQQKGGTGLGLAICKALVEAHDGAIGVESEWHKGSTFWLSLPSSPEILGTEQ